MAEAFEHVVSEVSRASVRQYARWDADLFREFCQGPACALWERIRQQAHADKVLTAYLQLVQEGIGAAYIQRGNGAGLAGRTPGRAEWPNFLAFCLVKLIPEDLARVPPEKQLPTLARVWNLCEGLLQEPAWVDCFVLAGAGEMKRLQEVESFLVKALEPVLTPAVPSEWKGPFRVSVLDTRPIHDEFLPGAMYLVAPTVLCVRDRRRDDCQLGIFLRPRGGSRLFLGLNSPPGDYVEKGDIPPVRIDEHQALIGAQTVALPFLRRCHSRARTRSGFLVLSAVDSQRLWIVESP